MPTLPDSSLQVLVLAPRGRDASVVVQVLQCLSNEKIVCRTLAELVTRLGETAATAVMTEETLTEQGLEELKGWIARQPSWSDFPFVILATRQHGPRSNEAAATLSTLGNQVLLERPLNVDTLLSAVRSALRSRRRQYEARQHLHEQETIGLENRRLYEAERQARDDAEAANKAKDEFLATLSHELRTPLSAILGWTYVLQQRRSELGDLSRGVDAIERNAKAQARLIEDLLDMSRIVAGKVSLELQTVVPANIVEQVIGSVLPLSSAKGITVEHAVSAATTPVLADPQRLQQIFWNLLTNAIKFTEPGGRIHVSGHLESGSVVIAISDNGAGISEQFLPLVFDRFRQADGSTTRSHGGLGLGLAIVRKLVELHGGSVEAFSAGLGAGATFTVRLPIPVEPGLKTAVDRDEPPSIASTAEVGLSLSGVKVLLVEDNLDGRQVVEQLLSACGSEVRAVESGDEALAALENDGFDVLVSDIGMPGMDGYELLRRVRARGNLLPALALTAFARDEDRTRALDAGFTSHCSKPVEPPRLIAAIAALAGQAHE